MRKEKKKKEEKRAHNLFTILFLCGVGKRGVKEKLNLYRFCLIKSI